MARWQLKLSEYDVEYIHIAGTQNVIADSLSRMPERFFQPNQIKDRKAGRGPEVEETRWQEDKEGSMGKDKEDIEEVQGVQEVLGVEESDGVEVWDAWKGSDWYGE